MDKRSFDKLKGNFPEMQGFTRRYLTETLTAAALIVGSFSAWKGFFFGGAFSSFFFLSLGTILAIFFPSRVDTGLKRACKAFNTKNRANEIVIGSILIVISLFFPFAYFCLIGLHAGRAYHYYSHGSQ